jgi:hypothetical protein
MNISFKDLPPKLQARVGLQGKTSMKRSKYGNKRATRGALKFDSEKEARRYDELVLLQKAGEVLWFIRQPQFELPGGTVYRADFLIVWDRTWAPSPERLAVAQFVTVEDVKSEATARDKTYRVKKREVEHHYGIVISEV